MPTITTETKERGPWSQSLEVGLEKQDRFGDTVFERKGYAQKFPGLSVARKREGSGAATYSKWFIDVPEGFAYCIRKVTNPGGGNRQRRYEMLYHPRYEE